MNVVTARRKMGEYTAQRDFTRRVWDQMPDHKYGWELVSKEVPAEVAHLTQAGTHVISPDKPAKPGRKAKEHTEE